MTFHVDRVDWVQATKPLSTPAGSPLVENQVGVATGPCVVCCEPRQLGSSRNFL